MKLYIQYEINESGKGKFIERLISELEKLDVKCGFDDKNCDVALIVTKFRDKKRPNMPCVIRIDGVHMRKDKSSIWRNKALIAPSINKCDAVIYQSNFCKSMAHKYLAIKSKKEYVIFNGANPKDYNVEKKAKPFDKMIISVAKWSDRDGERDGKKLNRIFETAERMPEIGFWIAGQTTLNVSLKNVIMLGRLPEMELRHYLKSADLMLYMPKYDWCPNSVIEGVCAGLPLLTSTGHGVEEIAIACGCRAIPWINGAETAKIITEMLANLMRPDAKPVYISETAKKYKEVFESCLH